MESMYFILAIVLLALLPTDTDGQTLYPRAARVYLPRLRRLLSFGGIVNRQPQDVIVSLDLSKEWPTSSPALTPSSTTLGMGGLATRAFDMVPVVARNGDAYDIMVYGGMSGNGTRAPKRYMLSTRDGVKVESVRAVDLGPQDYTAMVPTMSSVAIVLDEYFKDQGAQSNAPSYIAGGRSYGNTSAPATATVASIAFDRPANAFPPTIRQIGPASTEYSGLVYVNPNQLMIAGGSDKAWTFDLLRMEWREYKGMFPPTVSKRFKNQLVTYTAPSGRTYVISVGTDYTGPAGLFFYTDTSTQSNFTDAGPITDFDKVMFFHSVFMVDDQLVAIGVTVDMTDAEQFEPVLVFKVTEASPGALAFSKSDKFVPSSGSAKPIGPEDPSSTPSSSIGLILGITIPALLLLIAGILVFLRRRRQAHESGVQPPTVPGQPSCEPTHSQQPYHPNPLTAPAGAALNPNHQQVLIVDAKFPKATNGSPAEMVEYGIPKAVAPPHEVGGTLVLGDLPATATGAWSDQTNRDQEELILGDMPIHRQRHP